MCDGVGGGGVGGWRVHEVSGCGGVSGGVAVGELMESMHVLTHP